MKSSRQPQTMQVSKMWMASSSVVAATRWAFLCVLVIAFTLTTASAQSAFEHFEYNANTDIDGQGTKSNGWNGPWSGSGDLVVKPGLPVTCNGLAPSGNALGPTPGNASSRSLAVPVYGQPGRSLILSAVINSDVNGGIGTQATLGNTGETFTIGNLPGGANWALQNDAGVYYSNQPVVANAPTCLVARIDFAVGNGLDRMRLWVNPPAVLSNSTPADIDVTTARVLIFFGVSWQTQQGQVVDEISVNAVGGVWTQVTQAFPGQPEQAFLLTDGTVMVQNRYTVDWWRLSPDQYGNYANGSWSQLPSIPTNFGYVPFVGSSAVLPDGRVILEGGEYNYGGLSNCHDPNQNDFPPLSNCGAIFDPVLGTWTQVAPPDFGDTCGPNGTTWCYIGSGEGIVLPDGSFMLSDADYVAHQCPPTPCEISKLEALLPPPYTGPWIQTGFNKHEGNSEEGMTLLPSISGISLVMTVDTYNVHTNDKVCGSYSSSEIFATVGGFPGVWFCLGDTPEQLYFTGINEMGPAILRPDGSVFQAGADSHTAIFGSGHGWIAGPDFPVDDSPFHYQLEIEDGPAALLPNGNVLMMASKDQSTGPATFLELTPAPLNTLVQVKGVSYAGNLRSRSGQMLLLPTGQVLFIPHFDAAESHLEIYTPANPRFDFSWRPTVTAVNSKSCPAAVWNPQCTLVVHNTSVNTVEGLGFNGMSQGAAFGDEYQSATNYPLVRLTEPQGVCTHDCSPPKVYYCRTHDHSYMGVATGDLPVSTKFDCPGVPNGQNYRMEVVANGIAGSPRGSIRVEP